MAVTKYKMVTDKYDFVCRLIEKIALTSNTGDIITYQKNDYRVIRKDIDLDEQDCSIVVVIE